MARAEIDERGWGIGRSQRYLYVALTDDEELSAGLSFSIANAFKYPMPDDQYTPTIPTTEGDKKADIVGRSDYTSGEVYVSWAPLKYLSFTLGVVSSQSPFYADNQKLRLPFFNFDNANDNLTTFYLQIAGSY